MNKAFTFFAVGVFASFPLVVSGAGPEALLDPLETVPLEGEPECPWSKLNAQELKACQQRKQELSQMSKEERMKWNEEVQKRLLERRLRRIERIVN
ncbi:MAG: hypothetical protein IT290_03715 [Deltaproteobacteria bacterium]|nr:hypothetical protein [Deltaproteobacteria bacterium]